MKNIFQERGVCMTNQVKPQFGISWRTHLQRLGEIDDWITIKEYAKLYNLNNYAIREHFDKLYAWNFIIRAKREGKYAIGCYPYSYRISPKGIDKLEYIKNTQRQY